MKSLKINLENSYGIKRFSHEFSFENKHTQLIYAPNGMMKSSFAMTLKNLFGEGENQPHDRLHPNRQAIYEVLADGSPLHDGQIFVADPEDASYDSSASFTNFLVNAALKEQYDAIYNELSKYVDKVVVPLKDVSVSSNCRDEVFETFFDANGCNTLFKILEKLADDVQTGTYTNYGFRYNIVFDKGGKVKDFVEKNIANLQQYIQKYNELIRSSKVFRTVDGHTFGTREASDLEKFVGKGNFFEVNHSITLYGGEVITSANDLKQKFDAEKETILNNPELKKAFDKITKAIDTNEEVRLFKGVIMAHPEIILELADYEGFRKKVWLGYLSDDAVRQRLMDYYTYYQSQKDTLNNIVKQAKNQISLWQEIIRLYNDRFDVPFLVDIENQDDIILKKETAKLVFKYKDDQHLEIPKPKGEIYSILSKGEQRAFYILQLLFELESRRLSDEESLIVFDDIADSFDYQNKYAIIEYLNDLNRLNDKLHMIVLTHNFDFYRTLALRLGLQSTSWMCVKKEDSTLELHHGAYQRDLFKHLLASPNDDKLFVSLIPFVRNLVEYTEGDNSTNYMKLTSFLHLKTDTMILTDSDVIDIIASFNRGRDYERPKRNVGLFNLIMSTADSIVSEANPDEVKIENKIVLSIACRLKAEVYLKNKLLAAGVTQSDLETTSNQTNHWTRLLKKHCPDDPNKSVVERVNMMTPELIHINSFMYEPLIDMSVHHLIKLYNDCASL